MNFDELDKKHPNIMPLLCNLWCKKYPLNDESVEAKQFNKSIKDKGVNFELKINGVAFNFVDLLEDLIDQMSNTHQSIVEQAVIDKIGSINLLFPSIEDNDLSDKIKKLKHSYLTLIAKELKKRTKIFDNDALVDEFLKEATNIIN